MRHRLTVVLFLAAIAAWSSPLPAAFIPLTPPSPDEFNGTSDPDGGVGLERGAYITAQQTFSISSLGIEADLNQPVMTLIANIYSASGTTRGSLLHSASLDFADVGPAFYDVPINFTFTAGQDYDIAIDFPNADLLVRFFNFDPALFGDSPYSVAGLLEVNDGEAGGSASNFVLPHLRINTDALVVPEPGSLALCLLGSSLLGGYCLRRRRGR